MTSTAMFISNLRPTEILIILLIILLLFGAKKLPDLARGMGKSLRIFRAETRELRDSDTAADDGSGRDDEREQRTRVQQIEPGDAQAQQPESAHNSSADEVSEQLKRDA